MKSLIPNILSRTKRAWSLPAAAILCLTLTDNRTYAGLAQPFTPGNVVIERQGDGAANLNASAAPIYFDEMTTNGALVQSIEVTSNGASALTDVGNTGGDVSGGMTLAANGSFIVFPGYNTNSGTASPSSLSSAAAPRGVGKIDANGNYTLAATTTVGFNTSTVRGAASDGGTNFWATGTSGNTSGGVQYLGTAAPVQVYTNGVNANLRMSGVFNGALWFDTASSTALSYGIYKFANGFPITISQPIKVITLTNSFGSWNFSVSPDGNTVYLADGGEESATNAGIHKLTFNGSTWSQAYLLISNTPCFGLLVNYQTTPATIYATTANFGNSPTNNSFIVLQDNGIGSVATTLTTATKQEAYRGLSYVPTNSAVVTQAPSITSIYPPSQTIASGSTATISLFGNTGNPIGSNFWYQIVGNTTNLVSGQTGGVLVLPNATTGETGSYFAVITNAYGSVTSSVVSLTVTAVPTISSISPSGTVTADASTTVTFTLTDNPGNPAASNFWYHIVGSTTNLIPGATTTTLTLPNVLGASAGGYFAILTNAFGSATSAVVTLVITNDPQIQIQPASAYGLIDGQVQFSVTAFGTPELAYQWWYSDASGDLIAPVGDGNDFGDQEVISGATTSLLTVSNLVDGDLTNFVVVVTNVYGSVTSSVASLLAVNVTNSVLAFWDFNGASFTNTIANPSSVSDPVPYLGVGSAAPVGTCNLPGSSPFEATTTADPSAGEGVYFLGLPLPQPAFSWGVGLGGLPLSANISTNIANSNKLSGVQFNVSTVGAKNIRFGFDARATQTASEYERIQYTTNGATWIDYPVATSFNDIGGSGDSGWESYPNEDTDNLLPYEDYPDYLNNYYDFTGFPGVANNPNFGLRIVVEYESTATYGIGTTNDYEGVGETYAFGGDQGTYTYDLVGVYGDAITNKNVAPVISAFFTNSVAVTNESTLDTVPITDTFTVSGDTTADKFTYSAQSLNPSTVDPSFSFTSNADGNCTLVITPNPISQNAAAAPILVTVTDTNGDSSSAWFNLTVSTAFPSPTVGGLLATDTLANTSLGVPFAVSSPVDPVGQFTYSTSSGNNTVVPAGNVSVSTSSGGATAANPILNITPANNELGVAVVGVTVNDNDNTEQKSTSVSIPILVAPNTNILALDYFNYDGGGGPLDMVAGGFWQHLSGHIHQMQVTPDPSGGSVLVDTFNNTENLQTPLLGAPYSNSAGAPVKTLYYSFVVNMSPENMPLVNGTYFATFNDGQGNTADVDDCLVAATNGAALGYYRLGISDDVGATAANTDTVLFPQDLAPGSNYVVVTALNLATGQSTLWVSPVGQSSASVTAAPDAGTVAYSISDFELRESGAAGGGVNVSFVKVGKTFDSVFPSLHVQSVGTNVIVNWSDPTLGIQSATNVLGPFTDIPSATPPYTNNINSATVFYRFGR